MDYIPAPKSEYKKRSTWQWVVIYLILALIVYGFVYYTLPQKNNGAPASQTVLPLAGQTVTYTASGFSPNTLIIKKGSVVTFKNASADSIRVASDPHPIHDAYPTRGGCISSTFDSCDNIPPGQSWSFQFDIVGTWGYHNHLNSTDTGTIVVQ
jgi:plastocyanin